MSNDATLSTVSGVKSKLYGFSMYLISQAAIIIWALFLINVGPFQIDTGSSVAPATAWSINIVLILLFGVQHSLMARDSFKEKITRVVPHHLERSTFVGLSGLTLLAMAILWQPLPDMVYQLHGPASIAAWIFYGIGWVLVAVSTMLIDNRALHGLKQSFSGDATDSTNQLITPSLYKLVRHPMMLGFLIVIWATPDMTTGRLLLATSMTFYLFIGMHYEEKALVSFFGASYEDYQEKVPMILPWPR